MDRRKFIERLARAGWLAVLAAAAGVLLARRQVKAPELCQKEGGCRTCPVLSGCGLPEAEKERNHG
jgi:hypothetical protein